LITKYGLDVVVGILLAAVAVTLLTWVVTDVKLVRAAVSIVALLAIAFTLYFFRDPDRTTPAGDELIISPADGTVVQVVRVEEKEYLKGPALQISVFMSPLNVHVNRFPITGTVGFFRHVEGEFLVAFDDKSSTRNERTLIGIERGPVKLLFKQIAGFVARRIVADLKVGDPARAGERFGMIKFGSRVDVLIPVDAEVRVASGEKTVAGETVLAVLARKGARP
jgi:phosphatidylserine decarboxylase